MKKKTNLEVLRNLGDIVQELKDNPPSAEYWIEEQKAMDKRDEENHKFNESIKMSYEKYHTPFTI